MKKICKVNEKVLKDLQCRACPPGMKGGGTDKEHLCVVDFDMKKFKAADTKDIEYKDEKKTIQNPKLDKQEFITWQQDTLGNFVGDFTAAEAEFSNVDTDDDKLVTAREAKAGVMTKAQFEIGDANQDKYLDDKELKDKPLSQNKILEADMTKGKLFVNTDKKFSDPTQLMDGKISLIENN